MRRIGKEQLVMPFVELSPSYAREIFPGFKAHLVHSANMTFAHWSIRAGSTLPEHAHVHEQVVNMIEGVFELTIAGETRKLVQGSVAIIPSNALHSGKAITDCRIIDVFYPIREDYR
jgi:quercetin dioxygenase-like cupin family protein